MTPRSNSACGEDVEHQLAAGRLVSIASVSERRSADLNAT
jgi:hypothetical protein